MIFHFRSTVVKGYSVTNYILDIEFLCSALLFPDVYQDLICSYVIQVTSSPFNTGQGVPSIITICRRGTPSVNHLRFS